MADSRHGSQSEAAQGTVHEVDRAGPGVQRESRVFHRQERKYLVALRPIEEVVAVISEYLPIHRFSGGHDVTNIRTTYFDSPGLITYREYIQRKKVRRKIRMRQYGYDGEFQPTCWLEMKVKDHGISKKERFSILEDDLEDFLAGKDILQRVRELNTIKGIDQIYLDVRSILTAVHLKPVLRVSYDRISFETNGGQGLCRVTLDQKVRFELLNSDVAYSMDVLIMEVKLSGEKPAWLTELLDRVQARRVKRFSKFANAVEYLSSIPKAAQILAGGIEE